MLRSRLGRGISAAPTGGTSRVTWVAQTQRRKLVSFEAGENKSGHINAGPNEGVLFFNSMLTLHTTFPFPARGKVSHSTRMQGVDFLMLSFCI